MESSKTKLLIRALLVLLPNFLISHVAAEELIIQQEKLSFERCLQVITTAKTNYPI